jgi:hypothetical protein
MVSCDEIKPSTDSMNPVIFPAIAATHRALTGSHA